MTRRLIALLLALYVRDVRATVDLMLGTVYPGARRSLGGDVSLLRAPLAFRGRAVVPVTMTASPSGGAEERARHDDG